MKKEERLRLSDLIITLRRTSVACSGRILSEVNANEQARSRGSDACPLHLLCKCGVPAYRSRAVEQLTLAVAPVKFWRKGLLRFWLAAGFYTKGLLHLTVVFKA